MYRTVAELDIRLGVVSVRYGYRDMSLRDVTEVVRPLSFVSCLVSGKHTQDVVVLDPGGRHGPGGREAGHVPDVPNREPVPLSRHAELT